MVTRATTDEMPSLSALRLVEAACRHGNFRRAGRELNVTHSAISQQISRLEKQLDIKLFTREGMTMKPTAAAEELADGYRRASRALERSLERVTTRTAPRLVISLPASLANPWLRHRLDVFGRELSSAKIEVRRDDIEPDFSRVDAAVVTGERARPDAWVEPLFERAVTPVCSPAFQKAHGLYKPEHLLRAPLLVHDEEAWRLWFAAAGVSAPEAAGPVIDPGSAIGAAVDGYGVALACRVSAGTELEQGRLVQPFALWAPTATRFQMAWPKEHARLDQIHAFADWMRREVALSLASELPAAA
jgi:LysR family transcriptional regulator, glycine cleavage system transcriptional activator